MRPLPVEAKTVGKTAIDRFDDLPKTCQPAAPRTRPGALTVALGGTDHLSAIGVPPLPMPRRPVEPFVSNVGTLGGLPYTGQTWVRPAPCSQKSFCQGLVLDTGGGIAKARDHPRGIDRQQQIKPLIPTEPVAPTDV